MKGDVHDSICAYLLTAGTIGKQQPEIFKRFRHIPRETVLIELEALWAEGKVQRFTLGPKEIIWRATEDMNE
jgi:hypothetical protein